MSAPAFTPGPWTAEFTDTPYAEIGEGWVVDHEMGSICTLDSPKDEREANARLIAAAPELYEALEVIASTGAVDVSDTAIIVGHKASVVLQQARAALRKARGES